MCAYQTSGDGQGVAQEQIVEVEKGKQNHKHGSIKHNPQLRRGVDALGV